MALHDDFRFDALPDEMILHILALLDPKDVARCSRVSKTFDRLCGENQLWHSFCVRDRLVSATDPSENDWKRVYGDRIGACGYCYGFGSSNGGRLGQVPSDPGEGYVLKAMPVLRDAACAWYHNVVLSVDNEVFVVPEQPTTPVDFPVDEIVARIAANTRSSLVLMRSGRVFVAGKSGRSRTGVPPRNVFRELDLPAILPRGAASIVDVGAGEAFLVLLSAAGVIYKLVEEGDDDSVTCEQVDIDGAAPLALFAGQHFFAFITEDGRVGVYRKHLKFIGCMSVFFFISLSQV